jgi:arylsulfatase A-like enzyme
MSIFSSTYPSVHKLETVDNVALKAKKVSGKIELLAEVLSSAGFLTAGFHGSGNVDAAFGFDRGFATYAYGEFTKNQGMAKIADWLKQHGDQKFFMFLHTYAVHAPYTPTEIYKKKFCSPDYDGKIISDPETLIEQALIRCDGKPDCLPWMMEYDMYWAKVNEDSLQDRRYLSDLYDAEVRETDDAFKKLMTEFTGVVKRPTIFILLSDHGEEFYEHGGKEHRQLYDETTRVVLIIRHPHVPNGRRIRGPVSLIDVAPTVLDLLNLRSLKQTQGESVLDIIGGSKRSRPRFFELPLEGTMAVEYGGRKLMLRDRYNSGKKAGPEFPHQPIGRKTSLSRFSDVEVYNLAQDPREVYNLGTSQPEFKSLFEILLHFAESNAALGLRFTSRETDSRGAENSKDNPLPPETINRLKSLGYIK